MRRGRNQADSRHCHHRARPGGHRAAHRIRHPAPPPGRPCRSSYEATLYENGTLQEQYIYQVQYSGKYRMLYRSWEAPLIFAGSTEPYIQFVSIDPPAGSIGYAKDAASAVSITGSSDPSVKDEIGRLADTSEVGIFNPAYYAAGTYTVQATYVVHPPIEDDGTTAHLNFKFAGSDHIPYNDIRITVPADGVNQIYVYPPTLHTEKTGNTYTITGSAAGNENIAVEMLAGEGGFAQIPDSGPMQQICRQKLFLQTSGTTCPTQWPCSWDTSRKRPYSWCRSFCSLSITTTGGRKSSPLRPT